MSVPREPSSRTDDTELRRALWRFEHGHLSPTRIRRLLRAAYTRATRDFSTLGAAVPVVQRHAPELLAARDAFRAHADDALRLGRYHDALDEIFLGRNTLESMQALAEAIRGIVEAEAAVQRLQAHARVPRLLAMPCIQAPAVLVALARERVAGQRYARAAFLAGAALAECAPLERRERGALDRRAALEERLAALRALCADTQGLSAAEDADPAADGSLDVAASLARDGWVALAERLADELAFSLASRGRLHRELQRTGRASPEAAALLRTALAAGAAGGDAWGSVTAALWISHLEAGVRRAQAQHDQLEHARALLAHAPAAP